MIPLIVYTMIMTAIFCYSRTKKNSFVPFITKILASMGFVTLAVFASIIAKKSFNIANAYIIFGAIWGLIGDVILDIYYTNNEPNFLYCGIASFGVGHIFYILAIFAIGKKLGYEMTSLSVLYSLSLSIIFALITILGTKILKFDYKKAFIPCTIYTFVLMFTMIFSWVVGVFNPQMIIMCIGLTLFVLGDFILSNIYFGTKRNSNLFQVINHLLYYVGQLLIVLTLFKI